MTLPLDRRRVGAVTLLLAALSCSLQAGADTVAAVPGAPPASAPSDVAISAAPVPWTLAALPDGAVQFHGMLNLDAAGMGPGTMAYPVGAGLGVLGLLVGVVAHAAVMGGVRSSQESKAQTAADQVLDPYQDVLVGFRVGDLERRALALASAGGNAHLLPPTAAPKDDLFVQALPVFSMTPDAAALVLDEEVLVRAPGAKGEGVQQAIRVVSVPRLEVDLKAAWNANGGEALKSTAAALMAESLDIALSSQSRATVDPKLPFRTMRYMLGGSEKMERAQLLGETCDHLLVRNLRGTLMAVPHRVGAELPGGCPVPPVAPSRAVVAPGAASSAASAAVASQPSASAPSTAASAAAAS